MSQSQKTIGVHHVGLTVPDLEEALGFFVDSLGFSKVGGVPDYPSAFVSDGTTMITLWQAKNPQEAVAFDRKNVIGLHHLALRVAPEKLDRLYEELKADEKVSIEFAPEPLGDTGIRHMMCNIPSGIRMEFIAPPA